MVGATMIVQFIQHCNAMHWSSQRFRLSFTEEHLLQCTSFPLSLLTPLCPNKVSDSSEQSKCFQPWHRSSDPLLPFNTQCQGGARQEAILPLSLEQVQFHLSLPLFVCTLDCSQLTPIVQLRRELTDMSHEPSTKFSLSDKLKLKVPQC